MKTQNQYNVMTFAVALSATLLTYAVAADKNVTRTHSKKAKTEETGPAIDSGVVNTNAFRGPASESTKKLTNIPRGPAAQNIDRSPPSDENRQPYSFIPISDRGTRVRVTYVNPNGQFAGVLKVGQELDTKDLPVPSEQDNHKSNK